MLYSLNLHNAIRQIYFNKKRKQNSNGTNRFVLSSSLFSAPGKVRKRNLGSDCPNLSEVPTLIWQVKWTPHMGGEASKMLFYVAGFKRKKAMQEEVKDSQ